MVPDLGVLGFAGGDGASARRRRIVHVVSGLEIAHGGPSYSVPRLKDSLIRAGLDAAVFADLTPGDVANDSSDQVQSFVRNYGRLPLLRKFHFSSALARALRSKSESIDLIHSHGVWRMPNIYAARAAGERRIPHVVSPRGMLSVAALQLSARSKTLFWHLVQKAALEGSACVHATSPAEYADVRKLGIKAPVAIIPNGVDLPDGGAFRQAAGPRTGGAQRTLLYLGRIHPIKGLGDLVAAWSKVEGGFPEWRLRIVGPGEPEHIQSLRNAIEKLKVRNVSIEGPVFDADKWRMIFDSDLSILPSHSENFGIAVAESLACGRPVITTKGTPWQNLEIQKLGWWIDTGPDSIEAALRVAFGTPADVLEDMGVRAATWVKHAFSWDSIGEEMARVYDWLCLGAVRPACVAMD